MPVADATLRGVALACMLCWSLAGAARADAIAEESAAGPVLTEEIVRAESAQEETGADEAVPDDDEQEPMDKEEREAQQAELIELSCRDQEDRPDSWLDRTHAYFNQRLCEPAAWFDGFFGEDRALEETTVGTFFRLRNEVRWDQTDDYRMRVRLSANIDLPGASERLRLLITRDEDVRGDFEQDSRVAGSDTQTRVGLRYNLRDKRRSRFDLDGTVRANLNTFNPILRARYRHTRELTDRTFARFTQIGFWEGDDGFGTTSRADWEWLYDQRTQLRLTGQGTWSEATRGVDWRSGIVGYRQLTPKTAIRSEIGAFGSTRPSVEAEEYFVNFRFRRTFLRPWLFYELQPERGWPRDMETGERRGDWRFTATLEIQFENSSARMQRERREVIDAGSDVSTPVPGDEPPIPAGD